MFNTHPATPHPTELLNLPACNTFPYRREMPAPRYPRLLASCWEED